MSMADSHSPLSWLNVNGGQPQSAELVVSMTDNVNDGQPQTAELVVSMADSHSSQCWYVNDGQPQPAAIIAADAGSR
jgi:hypothetical protein